MEVLEASLGAPIDKAIVMLIGFHARLSEASDSSA